MVLLKSSDFAPTIDLERSARLVQGCYAIAELDRRDLALWLWELNL